MAQRCFQKCRSGAPLSVAQKCCSEVSLRSVARECPEVFSVDQKCRSGLSLKSVGYTCVCGCVCSEVSLKCRLEVSIRSVAQKCRSEAPLRRAKVSLTDIAHCSEVSLRGVAMYKCRWNRCSGVPHRSVADVCVLKCG